MKVTRTLKVTVICRGLKINEVRQESGLIRDTPHKIPLEAYVKARCCRLAGQLRYYIDLTGPDEQTESWDGLNSSRL